GLVRATLSHIEKLRRWYFIGKYYRRWKRIVHYLQLYYLDIEIRKKPREVERVVEVPVERVVTKEVVKEVPVERVVHVEVPVERVVTKEVPVERVVHVEVPVERVITKEVPVE